MNETHIDFAEFGVGEYVWFLHGKKQEYPGIIIGIEQDEFIVQICTNKKKSEGNDTDLIRGKKEQLRKMYV